MSSRPASSNKIRVVVVDDILETRDNLKKLLYFEDDIEIIGTASNGREGVEVVTKLDPDVVLMDINMPGMDGIAASEAISAQMPNVQVIMMSVQGESDYLRRSMLAGAREFLIKPFSSEELTTSIRRVHQLGATRRVMTAPPPAAAPEPAAGAQKPHGAKIIVFYSPKGGTGVSTLAVNIALAMRDESKARVAVVDANLQFGDVGLLLNLPTQRTISDVVGAKHEVDEELLNSVMSAHSTGVKALLAPPRPELAELVTADSMRQILHTLQKAYDYILVDTGRPMNDVLLSIFDEAEQIVLVAMGDIATLKNCKLFFDVTQALGYPPNKTMLVVNKEDGKSLIPVREIESNIKHPVLATLPRDDRAAHGALNRGIPFVVSQRASPLSANIYRVARMLLKPEGTPVVASVPVPAPATAVAHAHAPALAAARRKSGLFGLGRK